MIVTLKGKTVRRIGPASAYVILPPEYLETYGISIGEEVEMYMDTDQPNVLLIRKKVS